MDCNNRCFANMSVGMRKVYDWALNFVTKVDSKEFHNKCVQVVHEEGSIFVLQSAMAVQVTLYPFKGAEYLPPKGEKWIVVISEHHPILLWPEEQVLVRASDIEYKMDHYLV